MSMTTASSPPTKELSSALILAVASFSLYFYDYILTFEREVRLFWKRGRQNLSATGVLYLLARYIPMLTLFLSLSLYNLPKDSVRYYESNRVIKVTYWLGFFAILSSEGILIMRTYALWGCDTRVLFALILLLLALALPYSVAFNLANTADEFNRINTTSYALILGFETVILLMTMYRRATRHPHSTPLLRILYRDGIIYFVYTFVISLVNLIIVLVNRRLPTQMNVQYLLHSILATRVVLHIRSQGEDRGGTQVLEMTTLHFRTVIIPSDSNDPA